MGGGHVTRADGFHIIILRSVCDVSRLLGQNFVPWLIESGSPDNILPFVCPKIVSPDNSSCTSSNVPDSPDIVLSPDEQFKLGSYSSPASVNCTFLVKLDFDLTLTSSVAWTWVGFPRSVNEVLNKTSFDIEVTSWFTIDRQSRSTSRLRMVDCLFSVLSVTLNRWMVSIHSQSCLSTSLSSKSRSLPMTSGATFTVLFSRAMLLIPSLASSCCIRLDRTSRSNGTASPLANTFISAAVSTGRSGCPGMGYPDLSSQLVSGILS